MLKSVLSSIKHNAINIPGFRTNRKIIVIESDDWGSIRMPSKQTYEKFISQGFNIAGSDYNRVDTLESNDDLTKLFAVLSKHKDFKGNPAVMTANIIVGNPDFKRIKESDFSQYYFEPVTKTLTRYNGRELVEDLWKKGCDYKIFYPQFHGREHVNFIRWMNALKKGTPDIMFTFEHETTFSGKGDYNFMEVFDFNTPSDLPAMTSSLKEGLKLFEMIFGFKSRSFISPTYTWSSEIENTLYLNGVQYLQGLIVQSVPKGSFGNYNIKYHYMGQKNQLGQYFLIRNCFFEPSLSKDTNEVDECLNRINIAFRWKKPAVICSHRINFIGSLVEKNRTDNLKLLNELLSNILKYWPDVEFMTSDQLGDIIAGAES